VSDTHGRKTVLLLSFVGSAIGFFLDLISISSLLFVFCGQRGKGKRKESREIKLEEKRIVKSNEKGTRWPS